MQEITEYICHGCSQVTDLPVARRNFLLDKGFAGVPLYCDSCFAARLKQIWEVPGEKRQATCSDCGRETRLHFVPSLDKPVYCPECFAKTQNGQ